MDLHLSPVLCSAEYVGNTEVTPLSDFKVYDVYGGTPVISTEAFDKTVLALRLMEKNSVLNMQVFQNEHIYITLYVTTT
jgi:hypothetical protein